ncbi:glutamyl-tRNA reductase [Oceanitalea stevensii]|uniref:Glutamyl-tRNA reductase n=1 Tax=Oceanitalea stevensii TaxID=2763072 RepID=A0ABR8Z4U9_9MICO|nr:glutamyl-tRNA reductase [Oceanitalea stevensii]MBD8063333.1 glutamyl-tRNA reductase [Oceanitalea stevensii]
MTLAVISANHRHAGLAHVDRLSAAGADRLLAVLADHAAPGAGSLDPAADCGIGGAVVLSTCNRLEVYLDADDPVAAAEHARHAVARASGLCPSEVSEHTIALSGDAATRHLFEVASGLDSMVVGEREIVGQVRRSLDAAREVGLTTPLLERTFQHASRTSREVAVTTDLARAGASVASVALDLAGRSLAGDRALLVGTGAYAGVALAALRSRGVEDVAVWSASGRAASFAESHDVLAVTDLAAALARADVVVTCRGTGTVVLDVTTVTAALRSRAGIDELVVVDLALGRDVDPAVGELPGVRLVDLETVRNQLPTTTALEVDRARELVARGVERLGDDLASRAVDEAVVALRRRVEDAVADELSRLPAGGQVSSDDAARALRRLAARLLHTPTVHARTAARDGRAEEHVRALEQVLGLTVPAVTVN